MQTMGKGGLLEREGELRRILAILTHAGAMVTGDGAELGSLPSEVDGWMG